MCDHILNSVSYKPLLGISPNLQIRCSWGQWWERPPKSAYL